MHHQFVLAARTHGMGRKAEFERIRPPDARTGDSQPGPDRALEAWQRVARADIREEADAHFRHGEEVVWTRKPVRAMQRDAHATAHHDAIDQRDIGLGVVLDDRVQPVFPRPEIERDIVLSGAAEIMHQADVAPRAEGLRAGATDQHMANGVILAPLIQRRTQAIDHGIIERIERLRAIERDKPEGSALFRQNVAVSDRHADHPRLLWPRARRFTRQ